MEHTLLMLIGGVAIWLLFWPCHKYVRRQLPKEAFIAVLGLFLLVLLAGIVEPMDEGTNLFCLALFWPIVAGGVKVWRTARS